MSTAEKTSFEAYLDDLKPAGTDTLVVSNDADTLRLQLEIEYDPLVIALDTSTPQRGQKILDSSYPVEEAVTTYIQSIPFDSDFRIIDLVDAIQSADGVKNVVVIN